MKTRTNVRKLKGRGHVPRCRPATILSAREKELLAPLPSVTLVVSRMNGGRWKSCCYRVYDPFDVLEAGLDLAKFKDHDTPKPLDRWTLELFGL